MNDEGELVRKAADVLTEVYGPQWPAWVKLWQLSMTSMHYCVLAQVETGSGLPREEAPFSMGVRRMYQARITADGITRAFSVSPGGSVRSLRVAWKREIRKRRSMIA